MHLWILIVLTALGLNTSSYEISSQENMVRDRGQTRVLDQSQVLTRERTGTQVALPMQPLTFTGLLVDAGCVERTPYQLRQPPETMAAKMPAGSNGPVAAAPIGGSASAAGASVDAQTLAAERADIIQHLAPDVLSRQDDPSCAITASTSQFALLTSTNRLWNLDEAGNTYAGAALLSDPAGRAMLNGQGPGVKPVTVLKALPYGDHLFVQEITQFGSASTNMTNVGGAHTPPA